MNKQLPLIEVPEIQRFESPAPKQTVYLVAAYRNVEGLRYWRIWPETHGTRELAEAAATKLSGCWTHLSILGPVVLT